MTDTTPPATASEAGDTFTDQVRAELDAIANPRRSLLKSLVTLVITLAIFAALGLFHYTPVGIAVVIGVLVIHELGHAAGMKLFGYRDVKMFFIPLLGAAVSGREIEPRAARKAVVSLLGPAPGLLIGLAVGWYALRTGDELATMAAAAFLFINGFNLLPVFPLDGGHLFNHLVFSRHPVVEVVFKVLTLLGLAAIALALQSWFLGIFAVLLLLGVHAGYVTAHVAHGLCGQSTGERPADGSVPDAFLARALPELRARLDRQGDQPKLVAQRLHEVWQRVSAVPASPGATAGLLLAYLVLAAIAVGGSAMLVIDRVQGDMALATEYREDAAGDLQRWEIQTYQGRTVMEVPVDAEGRYHGLQSVWRLDDGTLERRGPWEHGFWHGRWELFDPDGELRAVVVYERGQPVSFAERRDGTVREIPPDQWPASITHGSQQAVGWAEAP